MYVDVTRQKQINWDVKMLYAAGVKTVCVNGSVNALLGSFGQTNIKEDTIKKNFWAKHNHITKRIIYSFVNLQS